MHFGIGQKKQHGKYRCRRIQEVLGSNGGVVPDEIHLMEDLWFIGWDLGQQIEVTLELLVPYYDVLYQDTLTIMPLGS